MQVALKAQGLSKRYRIGQTAAHHDTFAGKLVHLVSSPFHNLSRIRRLSRFDSSYESGELETDVIWALKDVSFEVMPGEIVGIIGPNGAGKSTLLKVLSKITSPTTGSVAIHGRVSCLLEVGTGFHPELSGRENVFLNGTVLGMSRSEVKAKFDEIVDFSGVEKFIDTPVKRYSSGMQVRLAFSVAAHLEPEILLIDEVLAVGDAEFQKKCLGRMENIAGEGRTVLFVSHNLSAVNRLCPRSLLLDQGEVIEDGSSAEVTSKYLTGAGQQISGRRTWNIEEHSKGEVDLIEVALVKDNEQSVSVVHIEEPVQLRITYVVEKPEIQFRCVVALYTQGVCAFESHEPVEALRATPGRYTSTVYIPGNLLAEGDYVVGVWIFSSVGGTKQRYVSVENAIGFQVYDPMTGSSARGDFAQAHGGVMRPLLDWRLESLDDFENLREL